MERLIISQLYFADIFPKDFMFRLSKAVWEMLSQNVMTYPAKRPKTAMPLAFTEHSVTMLANVLKSKKARQTSIAIVRAFIALKQYDEQYYIALNRLDEIFDTDNHPENNDEFDLILKPAIYV